MPTVALAPIPKWYFPDNFGRPLGAGKMYTYSNINKVQQKPVYQDPNGVLPWTNPILFNLNGLQGPFYWETNTVNPADTYYIEVYDKDDVLQFTIENYFPTGGGGGGGGSTFISIKNLISNNIFYFNNLTNGSPFPTPIPQTDLFLAPGPFVGFNPSKADIRFIKSDMLQTDFLNFIDFPLGSDPFTGDVTPVQYLRYECTAAPSAQLIKVVQFPITSKVNNLDNQSVTFTVWARCESGANTLQLYDVQYFGAGGSPTADNRNLRGTFPLTSDWAKYKITYSVASTSGATLGTCGDDAYYIQLQYPLDAPTQIWLAKPCLYLGEFDPGKDFDTNDQVMSQIAGPRPGDIRIGINDFKNFGWVEMDDRTIGNTLSGAPNRANIDTFPLFKIIWTNVSAANAPIFTSAGAPTTRGASAEADFDANKRLALTKTAGRALAGIGTPSTGGTNWVLGQVDGSETVTLTEAQMPIHTHTASGTALTPVQLLTNIPDGSFQTYGPFSPPHPGTSANLPLTITVGNAGGNAPHPNIQPTVHYRIFAKL